MKHADLSTGTPYHLGAQSHLLDRSRYLFVLDTTRLYTMSVRRGLDVARHTFEPSEARRYTRHSRDVTTGYLVLGVVEDHLADVQDHPALRNLADALCQGQDAEMVLPAIFGAWAIRGDQYQPAKLYASVVNPAYLHPAR